MTKATTSLTDPGTWIETRVEATIEDVLRPDASGDKPVRNGDVVDIAVSGGEAMIDGVVVRTDDRPQFGLNQRYLLSVGKRDTAARHNNTFGIALKLDRNDRLSSVRSFPSPLAGLSLSEVRAVIRGRLR